MINCILSKPSFASLTYAASIESKDMFYSSLLWNVLNLSPAAVSLIQFDYYFSPQTFMKLTLCTWKELICEHRVISSDYKLKLSLSKQKTIQHSNKVK